MQNFTVRPFTSPSSPSPANTLMSRRNSRQDYQQWYELYTMDFQPHYAIIY